MSVALWLLGMCGCTRESEGVLRAHAEAEARSRLLALVASFTDVTLDSVLLIPKDVSDGAYIGLDDGVLRDLALTYIDKTGIAPQGTNIMDNWGSRIDVRVVVTLADTFRSRGNQCIVTFTARSLGANRSDDGGAGDDLTVQQEFRMPYGMTTNVLSPRLAVRRP